MKTEELRTLDADELEGKLKDARRELYELRFKLAVGQLDNHRQIRQVRKDIARILTIVHRRRWEGWGDEADVEAPVGATRASPAPEEAEAAGPEADAAVGPRRASSASEEAEAAGPDTVDSPEAVEVAEEGEASLAPTEEPPGASRKRGRARKAEGEDSDG